MKRKHTKWPELRGIDDKSPEYRRVLRNISPSYWLNNKIATCKQRAKKLGVPFNLTRDYLLKMMGYKYGDYWNIRKERCPALGEPYDFYGEGHGGKPLSKSLDRIIPQKGYTKGNVRFIARKTNGVLLDTTPEELLQIAVWRLKEDFNLVKDKRKIKELLKDATNFIY